MENFNLKLEAFAVRLAAESVARLIAHDLGCEANLIGARAVTIKLGKVYAKVDQNASGRFMVRIADGAIFGIKGYGKVHLGHAYGTLDTTDDWRWGDYTPTRADRPSY